MTTSILEDCFLRTQGNPFGIPYNKVRYSCLKPECLYRQGSEFDNITSAANGLCCHVVSVRLSVRHVREFCQNE